MRNNDYDDDNWTADMDSVLFMSAQTQQFAGPNEKKMRNMKDRKIFKFYCGACYANEKMFAM